jgi:hypothetical protein
MDRDLDMGCIPQKIAGIVRVLLGALHGECMILTSLMI